LPAETLHDRNGIVTDAVDRKEDGVGTADDPGEQPLAFLYATIVVQKFSLCLLDKGTNALDVSMTPPDVEEASALKRGRQGPLALRVSVLWGRELRFGGGQFVTELLGLRIGVVQRCLGLSQGGAEHRMPLFRAFAPHHFRRKALLQGRDQFTEGHNLVGLFLGTLVGSSATLLGDLLSQYTVEAPNRRIACDNRFPQLRLLFLDLQGQFSPLRLQGGETSDIGTIGRTDQMGKHVHIGKG